MEILEAIDRALTVSDSVGAVANPDIHDQLVGQDGVTLNDAGRMVYKKVSIQRSKAIIPGKGYTVGASF